MAAEITEITYNVSPNLNGKLMKFEAPTTASGDWLIFDDPIGAVKVNEVDGSDAATVYAAGASGTVASATATVMENATFTANQRPASGYIMQGTEIMKYSGATKSSTSGDLTLDARGCFGTTAATHTSGASYILNTIIVTLDTAGPVRGIADIIGE